MDDGSKPPLISLLFLLLFAGLLSLAETALASVSKNRVKLAADRGDSRAEVALKVLEQFENAITTILVLHNLCSVAAATIVTVYVTNRWGLSYVSFGTLFTTLCAFFFGDMLPKSLGKKKNYSMTLATSSLIYFLMVLLSPISKFLAFFGNTAAKHVKGEDEGVTEDEIQDIIEDMTEEGTLDEEQSELITSAIQFGDVKAENILTPRVKIVGIDINMPSDQILDYLRNQTHSRIPVYKNSIDDIVGVLQVRKFMKAYVQDGKIPSIVSVMDKVHYANPDSEISELLPLMSKHKITMAVIKDSYGGTLGIVTTEDILEELVGDIYDESDDINEENAEAQKKEETVYLNDEDEEEKEGQQLC
ncbi:MAG: hemolysin family protein [Sphaerochaetaceae bacterium]|nr:hemolysin family protein [Sphaerochaetaceae bacterium]